MGLFRRRPKTAAAGPKEGARADLPVSGARTVHERIEVTVEREWVSMVVRNPAAGSAGDGARMGGEADLEAETEAERKLELP